MNFNIVKYKNKFPEINKSVFIADGVKIIGDVVIEENSSIWYNSVIRADVNFIKIGKKTNLNRLLALRRLEEGQLGAARRLVPPHLLQPKDVLVKRDGLLEVVHAIAGVQQFFCQGHNAAYRTKPAALGQAWGSLSSRGAAGRFAA